MTLEMEKEFERHQQGWAGFAKWSFVATVVVVAIMGILALTLV